MFTGLRAGNVIALRWSDIDLDAKLLHVARLKNGLEGRFPLADRVVASLSALPRVSQWVFPQHDVTKHIFHPAAFMIDGPDGKKVPLLRPHDCRRLFTTAARRAKLPSYVIDQMRGDVEKGVQGGYDQGSMSHEYANIVAKQIEVECGTVPHLSLVASREAI